MLGTLMDNVCGRFFRDFPEFSGRVAFVDDGKRAEDVLSEIKKAKPGIYKSLIKHLSDNEDRNFSLSIATEDRQFYIVNIVDPYDPLSAIYLPLIRHDRDERKFKMLVAQHEIGHVVLSLLDRNAFPNQEHGLMKSKKEINDSLFRENFADAYASLKIIQAYGTGGTDFVQRWSDLRLLSALKRNDPSHLTYPVLDAIASGDYALKDTSPMDLARMAYGITKEHFQSHEKMESELRYWQNAISAPSHETLLQPCVRRLFQAVGRQLDMPMAKTEKFVFAHGFRPGELTQGFLNSGAIKAVIGLDITANDYEDIKAVRHRIEQLICAPDDKAGASSNQFPNLRQYVKQTVATFAGNKYALFNAAASAEFLNDMTHKYFMRERILTLSQTAYLL